MGWVHAGQLSFERYLYTLHRLTGVALILYLLVHVYETGQRMRGEETWSWLMELFHSPLFMVLEFALFAMFVFHALNGVRLLLTELGVFLGRPAPPIYPYDSSVLRHRPVTYAVMIVTAIVVVVGGVSFFSLW
jgi:succinate dehydrogenase / fumarate reductase cytochrome b subunit